VHLLTSAADRARDDLSGRVTSSNRMSASLPDVIVCRKCGKPMDPGFVVGRDPGNLTSQCVAWLPAMSKSTERFYVNPDAEILWQSGPFAFTKRSRLPGFRCPDCKVVEFDYSHQEFPPPNPE